VRPWWQLELIPAESIVITWRMLVHRSWMNIRTRWKYGIKIGVGRWCILIVINTIGIFTLTGGNYFAVLKLVGSFKHTG
jgi:hypothetical protein